MEAFVDETVREDVDKILIYDELYLMLQSLTLREEFIIRMRFWEYMTFRDISEIIGVHAARISQIEKRALRKLGHISRNQIIKAWKGEDVPGRFKHHEKLPFDKSKYGYTCLFFKRKKQKRGAPR